jgi:uncharacterized protein
MGNIYSVDWRAHGMAVIVKYVVVSDGKDDMIFSTRQEAEAHDKMLDIAERLGDDTLEALTLFMAQHREPIGTILKGGKLQTSAVSAPPAALPQDVREAPSLSEPRSSVASPSAPPRKPKVAA